MEPASKTGIKLGEDNKILHFLLKINSFSILSINKNPIETSDNVLFKILDELLIFIGNFLYSIPFNIPEKFVLYTVIFVSFFFKNSLIM